MKTWLVTGAGRGIGAEIVKAALQAGDRVVATGRDPRKIDAAFNAGPDRLLAVALDVAREEQAAAAVTAAVDRFGTIDVLVNNAGYGQLGVFEETTPRQIREQFETNVFGLMNVTRAVLPIMRRQRGGRIFNISSVAGLRGVFGASIYNASKFAVEGFSQAIAQELAPLGVFVTVVSPGYFRTDFLDASSVRYGERAIDDYAQGAAAFRSFHDDTNHAQPGDPVKLAAVIVQLANADKPPVSFVAGTDAVAWATNAIAALQSDFDAWRDLSVTTDGSWARAAS